MPNCKECDAPDGNHLHDCSQYQKKEDTKKITAQLTVEEMWSKPDAMAFVKSQVAPTLTQEEWSLFVGIGRNTGMNPLLREIWAVKYGGK